MSDFWARKSREAGFADGAPESQRVCACTVCDRHRRRAMLARVEALRAMVCGVVTGER